jgi:cob(I)alamin adenosyltransferase
MRPLTDRKGLTILITGEGKGKTTSALGQALRACGQGLRVLFMQFMKGRDETGEFKSVRKHGLFELVQFGRPGFVNPSSPQSKDIELAKQGLERAREAVQSDQYDMIILDEILFTVHLKLLSLEDVKSLIRNKPDGLHLVLTGRDAHPELIEMADLVSEIQAVKHPYSQGIGAQQGIEY